MTENAATDTLAELLGSKTRARLLRALLGEPETRLHVRELMRRTGIGASSVQRELVRLEALGLIVSEREGSNRFYRADPRSALLPEVRALVLKAGVPAAEVSADVPGDPRINARVRPLVPALVEAARKHHVSRFALFGSSTETDPTVVPNDLDVLVTFEKGAERTFAAYFDLKEELAAIMGMPVDIVEEGAVRNPYFKTELEATKVVLYEAA